jgi:hypothetical protein
VADHGLKPRHELSLSIFFAMTRGVAIPAYGAYKDCMIDWLPWSLLIASTLHITEEFLWPGGFMRWYQGYRAGGAGVTARFLIIVNAVLLIVCCKIGFLGYKKAGVNYWLGIAALLCANGIWHVWASYKSHSYSPGVITGVLFYVPLATYGYVHFLRAGEASLRTAAIAGIIGGSYPFWSALFHLRTKP